MSNQYNYQLVIIIDYKMVTCTRRYLSRKIVVKIDFNQYNNQLDYFIIYQNRVVFQL